MNCRQKILALVMLGITGASYATDVTFKNNSDRTVQIVIYTYVFNGDYAIGATISATPTVAPHASATIPFDIPRTFSIDVRALTASPQRVDTTISSHSIRFAGATFNQNKTTYNISIADNKIAVS